MQLNLLNFSNDENEKNIKNEIVYINFSHKIPKEIAIAVFELPNESEALSNIQISNKRQRNLINNELNNKQQNIENFAYEKSFYDTNNFFDLKVNDETNLNNNYAQNVSSKFDISLNSNKTNKHCTEIYYSSLTRPLKINCSVTRSIQPVNEIKTNVLAINNKIIDNKIYNKPQIKLDKNIIVKAIKNGNIQIFSNKFNNIKHNITSNFINKIFLKNNHKLKHQKKQKLIYNLKLEKNKRQNKSYKRKKQKYKIQQDVIYNKNNQQNNQMNQEKSKEYQIDQKKSIEISLKNKIQNESSEITINKNYEFINFEETIGENFLHKNNFNKKLDLNQVNKNININNNCNEMLQAKSLVKNCDINLQVTNNKINNEMHQNEILIKVESKNNDKNSNKNENKTETDLKNNTLLNNNQKLLLSEEEKVKIAKEDANYWARKWLIEYGININYKKKNRERILSGDYDNVNVNEYNNFYSKSNNISEFSQTLGVKKLCEKISKELDMKVKLLIYNF